MSAIDKQGGAPVTNKRIIFIAGLALSLALLAWPIPA
jgi:hypothetical protein